MPEEKTGPKSGTSSIASGKAGASVDERDLKEGERRRGGQDVE